MRVVRRENTRVHRVCTDAYNRFLERHVQSMEKDLRQRDQRGLYQRCKLLNIEDTRKVNSQYIRDEEGIMRGSTIGEGGDTTISSPGRSPKQPLPGMRLHDPLHGRQACPKFIAFDQEVGQICPR